MGVSHTFSVLATRPREEQLAFAEAALREPYEELQSAAVDALSDPEKLNRPDLVFQRYLELLPPVRARIGRWKAVYGPVAREQIRSPRDRDRRAGYELLRDVGGMDALPALVQGMRDLSALVREKVVDLLEGLGLEYFDRMVAARAQGDPEARRFVDEHRALMMHALEDLLRAWSSHGRRVFLDVAVESGVEAYSLFTDILLARPASPVYRECLRTLSIAQSPPVVELLFRLLTERDPLLREAAVEALKERRDPEFARLLADWLAQLPPDRFASIASRVRDASWWGAVEAAADLPAPALFRILEFVARSGLDPDLRGAILASLQSHRDPEIRARVLAALRAAGHPKLLEFAARALEDADPAVRLQAARLVVELDPPQKARLLAPLLNSEEPELRALAAAEVGRVSFGRYMERFDALDPATRELAARALAKIDGRMVERLALEVSSLDADRRLKALRVTTYVGAEEELREVLLELLADPDRRVRATTVKLLHHSRNEEAMRVLAGALRDPDPRVRANAIEALEDSGDARYVPAIEPFLSDADNRTRANAAKALLALGRPEARSILEAMLLDPDEDHRVSAAWAIGEARYEGAEAVLRARLGEESSPRVREKISEALDRREAP